ncbi:MAG TPA: hypothetical protein VGH91_06770 [Gammaproteobacteria bacterium]|jgi:hypothetical protein
MKLQDLRSGDWPTLARRLLPIAAAVALLAWYLFALTYSWQSGSFFVSRDQWHFLPLVEHYLSGNFDWHELWDSHSEHVKPGYKLLFMLNAKYLGLDMRVEIMAGMLLLGVLTLWLLREMRRPGTAGARMPWLAWLTAGAVMMSFNQWANYGYGLLALGGFGGTLIQLGLFIGFSHLLLRGLKTWEAAVWVLLLLLGIFGFSGARGPAVVGSCLLAAGAAYLLDPTARKRILRLGVPFLVLGAACIGVYLKLLQLPSGRHIDIGTELQAILSEPLGALAYAAGIVAESMVNLSESAGIIHSQAGFWTLVLFACLLLGWSLWRYFRAGLWRESWVPLMLIGYSAAFTLEILVGRFGSDNNVLRGWLVPRYVFDSHLWLVGCAWILGLDWMASGARIGRRQQATIVMLTVVLVLEFMNLRAAHRSMPFQAKAAAEVETQLQAVGKGTLNPDTLPKWECPNPHLCQQGIDTLVHYHLDFARDMQP